MLAVMIIPGKTALPFQIEHYTVTVTSVICITTQLDFKMNERSLLTIRVTQEQKELISAMWAHYDWDLDIVADQRHEDIPEVQGDAGYPIPPDNDQEECPYCLCRPCVTSEDHRQAWWEEVHTPHPGNHKRRKPIYKRFWVMLANRGAWSDPRYLQRKTISLNSSLQDYVMVGPGLHPRDIMPECVLKTVRSWLPNMPSQPYMGHKWQ